VRGCGVAVQVAFTDPLELLAGEAAEQPQARSRVSASPRRPVPGR
jgi:hypothetical protein